MKHRINAITTEGIKIMAAYNTRQLAQEIIGREDKAATRELRKFLRDKVRADGGTIGTDTPGKGGRYSFDMTKREIAALKKKFNTWQAEQAEAKKERAAANAERLAKLVETPESDKEPQTAAAPEPTETDIEDETPDIDAMLQDLDNEDETVDEG